MTDYADVAAAASALNDPQLPPADLQAIAAAQSGLYARIAAHPAAYPDLLTWLDNVGDASVRATVAARRSVFPAAVAPRPAARPVVAPAFGRPQVDSAPAQPGLNPQPAGFLSVNPAPAFPPAEVSAATFPTASRPTTPAAPRLGSATPAPTGAPSYWLAPGQSGPTSATLPQPGSYAPTAAASTTADALYPPAGGFQPTPTTPWAVATPLPPYTGGLTSLPPPQRRRRRAALAVGLVAAVIVAGGVIGGVFYFRGHGGLTEALNGPPTLTSQQFQALAQETLPEKSGANPLNVHAPSGLGDDLIDRFCWGNTSSLKSATLEAGSGFSGLSLKLFDDADAAEAYLDTLSRCMTDSIEGYVTVDKTTTDAVTLISVETFGLEVERFAVYGNVVADDAFFQDDWSSFATGTFKPAVDEAGNR